MRGAGADEPSAQEVKNLHTLSSSEAECTIAPVTVWRPTALASHWSIMKSTLFHWVATRSMETRNTLHATRYMQQNSRTCHKLHSLSSHSEHSATKGKDVVQQCCNCLSLGSCSLRLYCLPDPHPPKHPSKPSLPSAPSLLPHLGSVGPSWEEGTPTGGSLPWQEAYLDLGSLSLQHVGLVGFPGVQT